MLAQPFLGILLDRLPVRARAARIDGEYAGVLTSPLINQWG